MYFFFSLSPWGTSIFFLSLWWLLVSYIYKGVLVYNR